MQIIFNKVPVSNLSSELWMFDKLHKLKQVGG